jgi:hypothetical protein
MMIIRGKKKRMAKRLMMKSRVRFTQKYHLPGFRGVMRSSGISPSVLATMPACGSCILKLQGEGSNGILPMVGSE